MARPEIAALDQALATHGETVTLRRRIGTSNNFVDLPMRARLAGFRAETILGTVEVTVSQFVMSPTAINTAVDAGIWPGAAGGRKWPEIGDWLVVQGSSRRIEQTMPVFVGGEAVRIDGRVLG